MPSKLGYIISERKIKLDNAVLGQIDSEDGADAPCMLIGWAKAKAHPAYKNILERRLSENLYWTFSRQEDRSRFEDDLRKFEKMCIDRAVKSIPYRYVNILILGYSALKKLVTIINEETDCVYLSEGMAYLPHNGVILGISLSVLAYCGVSKKKAYTWLKSRRCIILDKDVMQEKRMLGQRKYAIPYVRWTESD